MLDTLLTVVGHPEDAMSVPMTPAGRLPAMALRTSTLRLETPDGATEAFLAAPEGRRRHPGVLVFSDTLGLRPRLEERACHLADQGYVVLVPAVLHRGGGPASLTPARAMADAEVYLSLLTDHDQVHDGPVGTVGYGMGAALALRTAAHSPDLVAALAVFHGGRLVTEAPDSPHLLVDRLRAETYVASADHDDAMTPAQQAALDEALTGARVRHVCEQYDGAAPGFTMADSAAYDAAAAERHWTALLDLFERTLG